MELVIRRMLPMSLFAARSISIVENDATSELLILRGRSRYADRHANRQS